MFDYVPWVISWKLILATIIMWSLMGLVYWDYLRRIR